MISEMKQVSFGVIQDEEQPFRFEQGLLIFFGLHGCAQIVCGKAQYDLEAAGILAVNPFELFRVNARDGASVVCLHISESLLRVAGWDAKSACLCYVPNADGAQPEYDKVRALYAALFQEFFQNESSGTTSSAAGTALQLVSLLQAQFPAGEGSAALTRREETMQRLQRVLNRIHEEWNQDISLSDIAEKEYLSLSYLSRFFGRHLNITFSGYLLGLRLGHAARMLAADTRSVTSVAYECGFRNVSAFIEAFKQRYGQTPGQFRSAQKEAVQKRADGAAQFEMHSRMSALLEYAPALPEKEPPVKAQHIAIDCAGSQGALSHSWRSLLNIGYAHDGLLAAVQQQILQAQKDIGFRYLRFHGIFDENMFVYREAPDGTPHYDFTYVDLLLDFVVSAGLRPYIELSFIPEALAKDKTQIFDRTTYICGVKNTAKWQRLIEAAVRHFIHRYGAEAVRTWRFTTIGQSYVHLGRVSLEDYRALFSAAYRAVKSADGAVQFGGPGCFAELIADKNGLPGFLEFVKEEGCVPDFIGVQCHPYQFATEDAEFMNFTISQQSAPSVLSKDTDFMKHRLDELEKVLARFGLGHLPVVVEECNSTLWQRDLSSDTCYKAVWLAKNICENYDRTEAIGYWLLTDYIQERTAPGKVFHGGYGLFTYNGIPKAGYQMMKLLKRLGGEKVSAGPGWFATRSGTDYQLLLYNYAHYSNLYRYRYQRLERPEEAYRVFETGQTMRLNIYLQSIADGEYRAERRTISRAGGSAFDIWLAAGAPDSPRPEEQQEIRERAQPTYHAERRHAKNGLQMESVLRPLEAELIILRRIDK